MQGTTSDPLALYVHWPFCRAKCPYCDFNSHVSDSVDHRRWRQALLRELDSVAAGTAGRRLTSIFFGGGTPSLMQPETAAALIERASEHYEADPDIEITLEANPTSVEAGKLRAFRAAGVNRVSLGVQSLDDKALQFLGREHSAGEAMAAVDIAAGIFPRWSFDLIYARPGQSAAAWRAELDAALGHAGGHVSLYELTIEPGTRFHAEVRGGRFMPLAEGRQADLFELTQERMQRAGLPGYETSNHARPGEECRHNLTYWRYQDYAGIGPGAHGRLREGRICRATETVRAPTAWLDRVDRSGHGEIDRIDLSIEDQLMELLLNGLRLAEGVPWARIRAIAGNECDDLIDAGGLRQCTDAGLVIDGDGRLRVSEHGRLHLDSILRRLVA